MFEALIVTTSSAGLTAIGSREQRSYELIADTLRDRLGSDHAALFAEPVATEQGDRYDWYAPIPGAVRRLDALETEQRAEVLARLEVLSDEIAALAEEIAAEGSPSSERLSEALRNALQVPGEDYVYAIGDGPGPQPVLVNWAWTGDRQRSERGRLTGAARTLPASAPAATENAPATGAAPADPIAAASARPGMALWPLLLWLGWLILALMLAAIVALLVPACGLRGVGLFSFCPGPPPEASAADAGTLILQDRIDRIERRIAIADRACQPAPPPPPPPAAPVEESRYDRALDDAGARRGDLNFSLFWSGPSDIDLAVTCPTGARIWYRAKNVCNGRLDVDSNVDRIRPDPVENIYFEGPASGTYRATVTLFKDRTRGPDSFRLLIRDAGSEVLQEGSLTRQGESWTTTINYPGLP
ncbi:hypothetical protein CCR90_05820 [Rhodovulum sulfidophilum]|uniref:hypothetical protein n=1 Tax=Rhodovulum sulfidophilum TaxID=35806 RepID=UPI00191420B4|nr:hypothetical protein [Rhodovulum sulfidophilum]MBK5923303.1 hypothetical protein [Rhodovulum sulfidophilum]